MAEEKKIDNKTMNDKEDNKSADNKIDTGFPVILTVPVDE